MRLNGISVTFLPLDSLHKLPEKQKYSHFFNTIYFSAKWELFFSNYYKYTEYIFHIFLNTNIVTFQSQTTDMTADHVSFLCFCFPLRRCSEAACTGWARRRDRLQHQTLCLSWSWPSEGFYSNMACCHGDSTVTESTVTLLCYSEYLLLCIWFDKYPICKSRDNNNCICGRV